MAIHWEKLEQLYKKLKNHQSIDILLAELSPEYLADTINMSNKSLHRYLDDMNDCVSLVQYAAIYGNLDGLKSLARFGADMRSISSFGKSPLHFAAEFNHPHIIDYLVLELGFPVDIPTKRTCFRDEGSSTPLFYAAALGCLNAVERLISHGADVSYKNMEKETPVHYAQHNAYRWCDKKTSKKIQGILMLYGADYLTQHQLNTMKWIGKKSFDARIKELKEIILMFPHIDTGKIQHQLRQVVAIKNDTFSTNHPLSPIYTTALSIISDNTDLPSRTLNTNTLFAHKPSESIPRTFICRLSSVFITDPVSLGKNTFEREAIEKWLQTIRHCPITNEPLRSNVSIDEVLIPNEGMRQALQEFRRDNPNLFEMDALRLD